MKKYQPLKIYNQESISSIIHHNPQFKNQFLFSY